VRWLADFFGEVCGFFSYLLSDGLFGIFIAVVFAVIIIIVVVLAVCGIYWTADHAYRDVEPGVGWVVRHDYSSPGISMVRVGKVRIPQHHQATYSLLISVDGGSGWLSVTEDAYRTLRDGDIVNVKYDVGRLSGDVNVRDIMRK